MPVPKEKREDLRQRLLHEYEHRLNTEVNCDIEPWVCKVCGTFDTTRLYAAITHALEHVRRNELEPLRKPRAGQAKPEKDSNLKPGMRPLDLD